MMRAYCAIHQDHQIQNTNRRIEMEDVTITGLERVREPIQTPQGHSILAYFSCDVGVFSLKGCVLVRTARGGIATWLPKLEDGRGAKLKSVTLNDEPTRNAMLRAAREMYVRMGGTDADYRPHSDEPNLHPYRGSDENGRPTHPLHPNYEPPKEADPRSSRPPAIPEPDELPTAIKTMMVPVIRRTVSRVARDAE
jgi:hypothetical protein